MAAETRPLTGAEVPALDAYWRAANYLSVGQIYLMANPLLAEPLRPEHIKPRLLGHWGTSPGLNFVWAHLSRLIAAQHTEMMIVIGPGHEGGELGYSLSHACGAAFDNPGLVVACVVGDGEAETGPLATSWHGGRFLDPARDGAVLPILHLNGYKIANPALLARLPDGELDALLRGYGYQPWYVTGHEPFVMHRKMATALDEALAAIRAIQDRARAGNAERAAGGSAERARWPLIVLRTPKGWTGPAEVDGLPVEGTWRRIQVGADP